jgi:4-amino-4-deoxy-L-arabinose transferase-like glycosyltransferase
VVTQERITRLVLVGGFAVWIINGAIRWWFGAPLGHDEARYALDARAFVDGEPTRFIYSGGGMQLIGAAGIVLGATERALRFLPLLLGTGFLGAAYVLARRACGPPTAAWTVAVLAGSRALAIHGSELLSDIPAAGLLLLVCAILVRELGREDGPTWRLLWAAPLGAAAFYVRYGASVPLAMIALGFTLVAGARLVKRPSRIIVTVVLGALLLLPHAVTSRALTGSITGVLAACGDMAQPSTGWTEFLRDPITKYGVVIAPLMFVAIAAAPRNRMVFALQLVAVGHFVMMTLVSSGHARFVYFGTVVLTIVGVDALWRLAQHLAPRARVVTAVVALGAIVATWTMAFVRIPHYVDARTRAKCLSRTRIEWYPVCTLEASERILER